MNGQTEEQPLVAEKNKRTESIAKYIEGFDSESNDKYLVLREKIPIITLLSTIEATNKMNSTELRLRRWFKCTKFDDKCFATRNTCQQFLSHLSDKHSDQKLFCLYCSPITGEDNKQYYTHEDLVEHIRSQHQYRQYQCNLCLYRSISAEHILIHQQSVHSRSFNVTVNKAEVRDEPNQTYNKQNQTIKECKIIECTQLAETPIPDIEYYYQNYRHKRINGELSDSQCLYCPYLDSSKEELYAHCVAAHPDYPILIYNGINPRHSVNGEKEENEITETIENKTKSTKKRSFDESFNESDVTTNGVVDTYEFDVWTESEDEDMLLTEDDLSSDAGVADVKEPAPKRQKIGAQRPKIADILSSGNMKSIADKTLHANQTPYYLAACVSALLAVYLSVVVLSGHSVV